jgi:DNA-binding NarL/FixJ family response regulator
MAYRSEKGNVQAGKASIVIIEPNKQMQHLLRAMLANYGQRLVRIFSETESAVASMLSDPPSMVLLDWNAGPYRGRNFLRLIRHEKMYPLCLVPIIVMFSHARQNAVESALRLGAQAALVKPISPACLIEHIDWVAAEKRELNLVGERYVVEGVVAQLDMETEKQQQLASAREYQTEQTKAMDSIQSDVDRILTASF